MDKYGDGRSKPTTKDPRMWIDKDYTIKELNKETLRSRSPQAEEEDVD